MGQECEDKLKISQGLDILHPLLFVKPVSEACTKNKQVDTRVTHPQSKVFLPVISLDSHLLTTCLRFRRSSKPADRFTICLAEDDVGLVVSAELALREPKSWESSTALSYTELIHISGNIGKEFLFFRGHGSRR